MDQNQTGHQLKCGVPFIFYLVNPWCIYLILMHFRTLKKKQLNQQGYSLLTLRLSISAVKNLLHKI